MTTTIELPAVADFHVHLRDGDMMKTVVPTVRQGGVSVAYVMPNLVPPITSVEQALSYHERLREVDPTTKYLMTLYLSPEITPDVIQKAAATGVIAGVKSYPKGVTTNSAAGVVSYEQYYPVFEAMEKHDLVLNLHGEAPSGPDTTVLNAEATFLPTLLDLHRRFPNLRIVLEHCTTAAAVEAVKQCGPTVAATITAHHLYLTIDQWADNPHCFCKPVAKLPGDRDALVAAATSGDPKFFLGTDSAPHPKTSKIGAKTGRTAAGVFTQPYAAQYIASAFDRAGKLEALKGFLCDFGRRFYKTVEKGWETKEEVEKVSIVLSNEPTQVVAEIGQGEVSVVPFMAGEEVWSLRWKN
ncbi:Dihydroorotase [Ascodesmis nigricans]|uniref:dihydroorotase n=1 Tax=Ascodesmis nigricans TaxID=341454 RepID=A0A4S2N1S2_9PEZI|nr:Dihydroorotase [Ascodesmis nigricans]